jgi:hypothetical protein
VTHWPVQGSPSGVTSTRIPVGRWRGRRQRRSHRPLRSGCDVLRDPLGNAFVFAACRCRREWHDRDRHQRRPEVGCLADEEVPDGATHECECHGRGTKPLPSRRPRKRHRRGVWIERKIGRPRASREDGRGIVEPSRLIEFVMSVNEAQPQEETTRGDIRWDVPRGWSTNSVTRRPRRASVFDLTQNV